MAGERQEGDRVGPGAIERRDAADHGLSVAAQLEAVGLGEFGEGVGAAHPGARPLLEWRAGERAAINGRPGP